MIVDRNRGAPVIYDYDPSTDRLSALIQQVDDNDARVHAPFAGPDGAPWACSSAGAVYDLEYLSQGTRADPHSEPERLADPIFSDVVDCGYDAGSGDVVMFSEGEGGWRVASDGSRSEYFSLAPGAALLRGATW